MSLPSLLLNPRPLFIYILHPLPYIFSIYANLCPSTTSLPYCYCYSSLPVSHTIPSLLVGATLYAMNNYFTPPSVSPPSPKGDWLSDWIFHFPNQRVWRLVKTCQDGLSVESHRSHHVFPSLFAFSESQCHSVAYLLAYVQRPKATRKRGAKDSGGCYFEASGRCWRGTRAVFEKTKKKERKKRATVFQNRSLSVQLHPSALIF